MKSIFNKIFYFMTGAFCLLAGSCADDFPYHMEDIPEGEGQLSATLTFTPTAVSDLGATRTDGDALNDINSLCVLVYTPGGDLVKSYNFSNTELTVNDVDVDQNKDYDIDQAEDNPNVYGTHTDETKTKRTTVTLTDLPYGRYKIYAVANMSNLLTENAEDIKKEESLKTIQLTWTCDPVESNNQMFGYFTTTDNMQSKGFDAQSVSFTKPNTQIHAWLKRAASKVTVAFDPSGLKQGVSVYIKNVTIRDIPRTCYLGAENTPNDFNQLWNHLDTPLDKPGVETEFKPNTRLEYNSNGVITEKNPKPTGSGNTDGFVLQNGSRNAIPEGAHDIDAPSLFFYENNQQPYYDEKTKGLSDDEKKKYDKQQQPSKDENGDDNPDGVGTPIRDDKDDKDYKDRIPYGSYIEVEAYYVSTNPDRPGEGPIKYRFMLGKNVTDNYDAQRNYHFKLTLGFNRWANNPDWHIDYEQPSPGIEVQPTFRVSYLYHQKSELPIRILGNCRYLTVRIIENNWAPYDPESTNEWKVPPTIVPSQPEEYQFQWNFAAFLNPVYMDMATNKQKPQFGFLALHLPDRNTTSVKDYTYNDGDDAVKALFKYYDDYLEGERRFDSTDLTIGDKPNSYGDRQKGYNATEDDAYKVIPVVDDMNEPLDGQVTLMLPVWTRAKTLIDNSGLSGNNPYEGFERKAKLEITALFEGGMRITEYVDVMQVKRIVNPKGVWRAHDRSEPFYVTLMEADNSNGMSDFHPFTSEGEWTAFIERQSNDAGFTLSKSADTNGYTTITENGTEIHGYTGSTISFAINFGGAASESTSPCAIVKVLYHGNQCLHKILVRKGYDNPIELGGHKWSSFSLYQATRKEGYRNTYNATTGRVDNSQEVYDAVLTKNPLMLGSMFRRGKQEKGIFVSNNMQPDLAPFMPPGERNFVIAHKTNGNWDEENWTEIGYRADYNVNGASTGLGYRDFGWERGNNENTLGTFEADGRTYKVPTYEDFQDLADACENGFGVFYGSAATEPATTAEEAYGLIDPNNEGLFNSKMGMRGVIAYDRTSGDQIFFPMGKYGTGRRNNFVMLGDKAGVLRYGDVDYLLTIFGSGGATSGNLNGNLYRPVPYNLMAQPGNVYWVDKLVPRYNEYTSKYVKDLVHTLSTAPCLGWDMNYFNFDFNAYTANNWRDACPIKLIVVKDRE